VFEQASNRDKTIDSRKTAEGDGAVTAQKKTRVPEEGITVTKDVANPYATEGLLMRQQRSSSQMQLSELPPSSKKEEYKEEEQQSMTAKEGSILDGERMVEAIESLVTEKKQTLVTE